MVLAPEREQEGASGLGVCGPRVQGGAPLGVMGLTQPAVGSVP